MKTFREIWFVIRTRKEIHMISLSGSTGKVSSGMQESKNTNSQEIA